MLGTNFVLTNQNAETIDFNDYVGGSSAPTSSFIILQDYPQFDIEINNQEIRKEGQHGIWDFYSFYGKRVMTFTGKIYGPTEADVEQKKQDLERVVALPVQPSVGNDGTVTITWTSLLGGDYQIEAKIQSSIRYNRPIGDKHTLDFIITMKAASPFIESLTPVSTAGVRAFEAAGYPLPVIYPTTMPYSWVQSLSITNSGTVLADTSIKLYGGSRYDINNPRITNLTDGKFMQINTVISGASDYIVFSSKTGTIQDKNGVDLSPFLETGSEFIKLELGVNEIVYTSDENVGVTSPILTRVFPNEVVIVEHKNTIV